MARANVDVVVQIYDAWNRGDPPGILEKADGAFEFHDAPQFPEARILQGEHAKAYLRNLGFGLHVEIAVLKAAGDDVMVFLRERQRGGSSLAGFKFAHLWTIRDGRATRLKLFFDPGEAWDELGLRGEEDG